MKLSADQSLPMAPYTDAPVFSVFNEHVKACMAKHYSPVMLADPDTQGDQHFLCEQQHVADLLGYLDKLTGQWQAQHELYVTVVKSANDQLGQQALENLFYQAGFHLDAREWLQRDYAGLQDNRAFDTTTFRRIKQTGHPLCTLNNLLAERDLHMDMLREFSCRSDAHVFRYAFAQHFIRPGDRLLDCACGLGYGSYLMSLNDRLNNITAVDICSESVSYANQVYGHDKLHYETLDIDCYADTQFEPFDLITSFETIEHVKDYHSFFKLCLRSLKPDGRVIASVPYMWVDETGKDPNPYHFHEFDWKKFADLFAEYGFVIEARYHQTAPGGFKLTSTPRRFDKSSVDAGEIETEWLVVVATPDLTHPLWQSQQSLAYSNPQYPQASLPAYVDFDAGYHNPWLHRQLVQVGQRIEDADIRRRYVESLLASGAEDHCLLLTIQGYSLEANPTKINAWLDSAEKALDQVERDTERHPFAIRWLVSLAYLSAIKCYEQGDFLRAKGLFQRVLDANCSAFCPVLNVKAVEACFALAKIALYEEQREQATVILNTGKHLVFEATAVFKQAVEQQQDQIGEFLWSEMAELFDAGALLNKMAIALSHNQSTSHILRQAAEWEQNKRFGLFNLVEKYRKSSDLTVQADMQLVAQSFVNKLVAKAMNLARRDNIHIWGTGVVAQKVCEALAKKGVQVCGFIDSQARAGQQFAGLPVITPADFEAESAAQVILTSVGSSAQLAKPLEEQGVACVYLA